MPDTTERVYADIALGVIKYQTGDKPSALSLVTQAVDLARRIGDQDSFSYAGMTLLILLGLLQHTEQRVQLAEELWVSLRHGLNIRTAGALYYICRTFLSVGQRQRAEEVLSELWAVAKRTGVITLELSAASVDLVMAVMDGNLEQVSDMAVNIITRGEEAGITELAFLLAGDEPRAKVYLGTSLEVLEREIRGILDEYQLEASLCLVLAHLGRKEEVSEILEKYVAKRPGISTIDDEAAPVTDILFLEASVLISHREAAVLLHDRFKGTDLCTPTGLFYLYPSSPGWSSSPHGQI